MYRNLTEQQGAPLKQYLFPKNLANTVLVTQPNGHTYYVRRTEAFALLNAKEAIPDVIHNGKVKSIKIAPELKIRGLSCKVGEYLASALSRKHKPEWAQVMYSNIQMKRETASA